MITHPKSGLREVFNFSFNLQSLCSSGKGHLAGRGIGNWLRLRRRLGKQCRGDEWTVKSSFFFSFNNKNNKIIFFLWLVFQPLLSPVKKKTLMILQPSSQQTLCPFFLDRLSALGKSVDSKGEKGFLVWKGLFKFLEVLSGALS